MTGGIGSWAQYEGPGVSHPKERTEKQVLSDRLSELVWKASLDPNDRIMAEVFQLGDILGVSRERLLQDVMMGGD